MAELGDLDAYQTTAVELAMEVDIVTEQREDVIREIEAVRQQQQKERDDVRTSRQRVAVAERRRKAAEEMLAKEKQKTKVLRREKKVKGDAVRFYRNQTAEARLKVKKVEDFEKLENEFEKLQKHCNMLSTQLRDVGSQLGEREVEVEQLSEQLAEQSAEEVVTFEGGNYTERTRMLIYSLLSKNVAHERISDVITECLAIADKKPSKLPTAKTIGRMNIERLALA